MEQQNSNSENNKENNSEGLPEVQYELSKVASNPKQSILILVGICGIFGYILFNFFVSTKPAKKEISTKLPTEVTKPAPNTNNVPSIPQLPEPPKLVVPTPPPPLPEPKPSDVPQVIPPMPQNNLPLPSEPLLPSSDSQGQPKILINDEEAKKRKDAKRKSSIILVAGTESKKTQEQIQQEENFKVRGNMELVLGRGKIIDAVLESAISTDFGGEVRSVISRDVFSESGKNILVPKGSRVFGTYSTGIDGAYGRISIEWNRIDLASGYTLSLQGAGIDNLGRKGYQGRVDNKFKERFSNAILMSAFNIGFANALDKVVAPPTSTQTAATNTSIATNMQNTALAIYNAKAADASEDVTINKICSSTQALITDKTSTAYTTLSQACTSLITNANIGSTTGQRLSSLMNTVNSAAASLLTSTTTATTPTQAQNASKQAFTDVTNTVKDMLTQQQFKPTITIDQGTAVKIYVTKDYVFPKAVLSRSRLVK